ncbi:hypothetical protein OJ998_22985 [Solirubrobacter taibaiensis]|nr:hypothetical protein [Solirubrobacter taibaiensis]
MSTTAIVVSCLIGAVIIAVVSLWAKRRFDHVAARRDEIGDRDLPGRKMVRTIVIAALGTAVGAQIPIVWSTDAGLVLGVCIVSATYALIMVLSVRDAEAAQR